MNALPEEVFLENDPKIDPVTMSLEVISRTTGMTSCVRDSLTCRDGFSEEAAEATLWQIEGNLRILNKIINWWHEEDTKKANSAPSTEADSKG